VAAEADYLFTHDRGYLHDGLSMYGVQVISPDEFLAPAFDSDPQGMLAVMERVASSWAGGRPAEELLDTIERAGAPNFTQRAALRKLLILDAAETLDDLRVPPGNRLEKLKGDRAGSYSVRINQQWRICFSWTDAGPEGVEIVDYH